MDIKFEYNPQESITEVVAMPSHENGRFLINDNHYGDRIVNRIVLTGLHRPDVVAMQLGNTALIRDYITFDEADFSMIHLKNCTGQSAVRVPGSNSSVYASIQSFRELAPCKP